MNLLFHMHKGALLIYLLLVAFFLDAQSITPFTVNVAGFTVQNSGYTLTISTGETISITNFTAPNGASLNSGFLQNNPPIVTSLNDVYAKIGTDEVLITPNPTKLNANMYVNFKQNGSFQFQIIDVTSKLLYRSQSSIYLNSKVANIDLTPYPSGIYYIQVYFKPLSGSIKSGIYKIVKL
jgi:hypothetical protein